MYVPLKDCSTLRCLFRALGLQPAFLHHFQPNASQSAVDFTSCALEDYQTASIEPGRLYWVLSRIAQILISLASFDNFQLIHKGANYLQTFRLWLSNTRPPRDVVESVGWKTGVVAWRKRPFTSVLRRRVVDIANSRTSLWCNSH